ncbi:MAG: cytochrome-c oxidase, cbb3-type subunit III [Aestuariivirga sp.]|uniref:cytochrome-c oxidase, cbb3-type subunit III n=1 Tax=Aestuariivirga sp. TaxID=2650926 RepID=UPI0038D18032
MATNIEKDDVSGTATTGHEWDGIKELNTPLPRWWLYTFYATVIWGLAYTVVYPAWPMLTSATPGLLGWSSRAALEQQMATAREAQQANLDKIAAMSVDDILKDPQLLSFAQAGGAAAFKVNCVQCHGSGAAGFAGYPNLNDDDWLWGGTPDALYTTLKHGIRYAADPDTRDSQMPAFGADGILLPEQIDQVANYVASLSGGAADAAKAETGKTIFAENCAACHGEDGKGLREFGAPNLTDKIALYGGTLDNIKAQIVKPRLGVMPGWTHRLDDTTIKQLAVYVHTLGGGELTPPATQ